MTFQFSFIKENIGAVLAAVPITLLLSLLPVILGAVLGFALALLRIRKIPVLDQILSVIVSFFRGVPLLLILFLTYYGIPKIINFTQHGGVRVYGTANMSALWTALIAMTLYSTAFLSEIMRGALLSIDMKQMEAAHSIGMTRISAYIRIIIPQAVIVALPNYFNFVLAMIKNTSIVFTISVMDIMAVAKVAAEEGYRFIEAYVMVGAIYILFSFIFSKMFSAIEKTAKNHMGIY